MFTFYHISCVIKICLYVSLCFAVLNTNTDQTNNNKNIQEILMLCVTHSAPSHLGGVLQIFDVEQSVVDPEDDPVKEGTVQGLRHGVSHRTRLSTHR